MHRAGFHIITAQLTRMDHTFRRQHSISNHSCAMSNSMGHITPVLNGLTWAVQQGMESLRAPSMLTTLAAPSESLPTSGVSLVLSTSPPPPSSVESPTPPPVPVARVRHGRPHTRGPSVPGIPAPKQSR
ncbi:hypothetical protein FKM82_010225 [Ascaphus truei]